jgi:hypothetical protein
MANKTIPLKDKQLVVQRLATGMSTRQAIKGTNIASNKTAALLAKDQSHIITQRRASYIDLINYYAYEGEKGRAVMLADMVEATKFIKKPVAKYYSSSTGRLEYQDTLIEVPDWHARYKAIKHIDQLSGYMPMSGGIQVNVLQNVGR